MHEVCPNIRDPDLWTNVRPEDRWAVTCRNWDRRVSIVFGSSRPQPVVKTRDPLFPEPSLGA